MQKAEKKFTKHIPDKGLEFRMYKELLQVNSKRAKISIKKMDKSFK
jgi:hypothetical protein